MQTITNDRLLKLVDVLVDLLLAATDNAALVESCIRSVGFSDDELRSLGFDVGAV